MKSRQRRENTRNRGDYRDLHEVVVASGMGCPSNLTQVGGLHERQAKFSDFLDFPSLPCPQHHIVSLVGKNAIGQHKDVARLKSIALVAPQLEVHGRRLVRHQCHARLELPFQSCSPFLHKYEFGIYVVLGSWYDVL